jgi:hypothetical protein
MFASRIAREKATATNRNNQRGAERRNAALERHGVPGGRGQALPESIQAAMGSRMGFDFSQVRVHADTEARSAARAMGARGWTLGEHVVLGERADAHTLTHELAHVVQQSEVGASRSRGEDGALERDADAAAVYGHRPQLRAPSPSIQMQPEDDDRFRLRKPSILGNADDDQFKLKTTFTGKKPERHFGEAVLPGTLEMQLTPLDQQRIDAFLLEHGFHLQEGDIPGVGEPVLDGKVVSMPEIAEMVAPMVMQGVGKDKIQVYLANIYMKELMALTHKGSVKPPASMQFTLPAPSQPAAEHKAPGKMQGWQTSLGAGVQVAWHANVVSSKPTSTPRDTTIQFQVGRTYAAHADKESGSELQGMIQVGYNVTTHQYTVLSGGQFTEVISLFDGLLQVSEFVQLMAGIAAGGGSVSGQIQPSFGGQALVQVGPVQVGGMFFAGATVTPGGESTFDKGGGLVIQGNF